MSRSLPEIPVTDSHVHFFSPNFIAGYAALGKDRFPPGDSVGGLLRLMKWEMHDTDPVELGRRWVQEMDDRGLARLMLITSWLWDEEATAKAVQAFPGRLSGYVMIDPTQPIADSRAHTAVTSLGLKGITLFPAMHGYHASEPRAYVVYRVAARAGVPVFVHFGLLKLGIRDKLGLVSKFDLRFSNPLDLLPVAKDFPETPFILPHFGGGFFQEMLMVASQCPNVCVDSSSSNAWIRLMPYPLTLKEVFAKTLDILGPDRILFGSDSTAFPTGWRQDIFETQAAILQDLGCSGEDISRIFSGNAARIFRIE
jgi:predicted TIM-barrel fold metal-dependent hydrolase